MILVAAVLLLVALGLLATGLAQGSAALQWGSFAASALAVVVLGIGELRRRRTAPDPAAAGSTTAPRADGPSADTGTAPAEAARPAAAHAVGHTRAQTAAHAVDTAGPANGAHAAPLAIGPDGEPPVEEVEVTDLLLVLELTDEVLVVDEHPRYHVADCPHLAGVDHVPVPMDQARTDGFTPCGTCAPDRELAGRERARRAG